VYQAVHRHGTGEKQVECYESPFHGVVETRNDLLALQEYDYYRYEQDDVLAERLPVR